MKTPSLFALALSVTSCLAVWASDYSADENPHGKTATVTRVVQGMMKSQSGAT